MRHRSAARCVASLALGGTTLLGSLASTAAAQARPVSAPSAGAVRAEVERRSRAFADAFSKPDPGAAAGPFYTPDARIMPPDIPAVIGRERIVAFWRRALETPIGRMRLETGDFQLGDGGRDATVVGRYTIWATGGAVAEQGKYMMLWRRAGDAWYVHRDIWNTDRPSTSAPQ